MLLELIHLVEFLQGLMWWKVERTLQTWMSLLLNATMTCKALHAGTAVPHIVSD